MPKLDLEAIPLASRSDYPPPYASAVAGRWQARLEPILGMERLGAGYVVLKPGAWSSQRHWHVGEDELLVMLTGAAVLVEDGGETLLGPGDCCAWAAGVANGHHLQNRSDADCSFVVVSAGADVGGDYPDIDMMWEADGRYRHRDGRPYPEVETT